MANVVADGSRHQFAGDDIGPLSYTPLTPNARPFSFLLALAGKRGSSNVMGRRGAAGLSLPSYDKGEVKRRLGIALGGDQPTGKNRRR